MNNRQIVLSFGSIFGFLMANSKWEPPSGLLTPLWYTTNTSTLECTMNEQNAWVSGRLSPFLYVHSFNSSCMTYGKPYS